MTGQTTAVGGGARVVTGEPGCGRTAFLARAARSCPAASVVGVRADRVTSAVPLGGLRALLRALGAPVGPWSATGQPGAQLLDALRAASAGGPMLVCVDDAHLWDAPTRAAVGRAAEQLRGSGRVSVLLSVSGHRPVDREFAALPVVRVDPLSPAEAAALLDEATGGALDRAVRDDLVDAGEGSPALLLAMVRRLSPAQIRGHRRLPGPPADAELLTGLVGGHLTGFTPAQEDLLLTVAAAVRDADDTEDARIGLALARRGAEHLRGTRPGTESAPSADPLPGVLVPAEGEVGFHSDLLRRAVYAGARPERRRDAHRALARALEEAGGGGLPALLHRARSVTVPRPGTATELAVAAGDRARPRSLRCAAYAHAAALAEDGTRRAEWYTAAAEQALLGGRTHRALRLLDRARDSAPPTPLRGRVALVRGTTVLYDGPVDEARASLLLAARLLTSSSPRHAQAALLSAVDAAWAAGDAQGCLHLLSAEDDSPASGTGPPRRIPPARPVSPAGSPVRQDRRGDDGDRSPGTGPQSGLRPSGDVSAARSGSPAEHPVRQDLPGDGGDRSPGTGPQSGLRRSGDASAGRPGRADAAPGRPHVPGGAPDPEVRPGAGPFGDRTPGRADGAPDTDPRPGDRDLGAAPGGSAYGGVPARAGGGAVSRGYRTGLRALLEGQFTQAAGPLRRLVADAEAAGGGAGGAGADEPDTALRAAAAALLLGDLAAARRAGARALAAARTPGTAAALARAREYLAYAELRAGRHALARTHAEEGLRAAHRTGQRNTAAHHHAVLALAACIEGAPEEVAAHADIALATARRHGLVQAATLAEWAVARADLARGRPREAADRLGPLVRPGPRRGHFAVWMLAVPCFVEAAASTGRADEGVAGVVEEFARWAGFGADPQAPAQLTRCRALLAPADRPDALYRLALDLHDAAGGDFERARTELLHGKWLRRRRRLSEARDRLGAALVGFERCGARPWADQARAELRAGGVAPGGGARATGFGPGLDGLTPQQLRIARCVAEGATNREVALTLSVSTRTVDYHLRKVFAALGVRSRVELVRMVEKAGKEG
ncbi:DNA-binding CsgD family transcriptional regulator [Streptomyces sp. 3330]|uniref:helix-turn-helix transcriptional regulator n=1 Tax=Streptomyces sp. 3330 TaxID=2817755 RepID=UPI002858801F|nr:LuxR C-terminal-related transcriptional regulator [Streptomyces sp. 3330]MDR6975874.1 DNA-binding CsgD family transcriptional regulator [Streptomyces sp. 3330]